MGFLGTLVKGAVATKALQIAQRELRKPQNQQRINDALAKVKQRRGPARA